MSACPPAARGGGLGAESVLYYRFKFIGSGSVSRFDELILIYPDWSRVNVELRIFLIPKGESASGSSKMVCELLMLLHCAGGL